MIEPPEIAGTRFPDYGGDKNLPTIEELRGRYRAFILMSCRRANVVQPWVPITHPWTAGMDGL
jgi:hypothetical protein